jgi:hypothetical protein
MRPRKRLYRIEINRSPVARPGFLFDGDLAKPLNASSRP